MSRNTQGVTLIRLSDDEKLVGVVCLDEPEEEDELLAEEDESVEAAASGASAESTDAAPDAEAAE